MRMLDLFCGAGGCTRGYQLAGFEVIGVDIKPQPRYCGTEFIESDALTYVATADLSGFDAIHASPPCQAYSVATNHRRSNLGIEYPDLVDATRAHLDATGLPWIMENVPGAPLRDDIVLCGCNFGLPLLRRQRIFETSWRQAFLRMPCHHTTPILSVTGQGVGAGNGQRGRLKEYLGHNPGIREAKAAMGIDWMTRDELAQAIPPAYTELVGGLLIEQLRRSAA